MSRPYLSQNRDWITPVRNGREEKLPVDRSRWIFCTMLLQEERRGGAGCVLCAQGWWRQRRRAQKQERGRDRSQENDRTEKERHRYSNKQRRDTTQTRAEETQHTTTQPQKRGLRSRQEEQHGADGGKVAQPSQELHPLESMRCFLSLRGLCVE